jgi:hypothetical protein
MPQEVLKNLLLKYQNKLFLQDSFDNELVVFFNEERDQFRKLMNKYAKSDKTEQLDKPIKIIAKEFSDEFLHACQEMHEYIGRDYIPGSYGLLVKRRLNALEFVDYGIKRGYDWQFLYKDEWELCQPKKKHKFIKPKKR